jgi:hypothetical protein
MDRFAQYKWVLQLKGISIWCTWILGVQCIFVGSKGILSETQVFTIAKGDAVEAKKTYPMLAGDRFADDLMI